MRQGSTWGPDAGSTASSGGRAGPGRRRVVKDQIDENYEDGLRMLTPLRCCFTCDVSWCHATRRVRVPLLKAWRTLEAGQRQFDITGLASFLNRPESPA